MAEAGSRAFRGSILHCLADPGDADSSDAIEYIEDGVLIVTDGRIRETGPAGPVLERLPDAVPVVDVRGNMLVPGFVDCHVHYPQVEMIASRGTQLLDWLERHAYPTEARFADAAHARDTAEFFADELLRNGTTTALVFATSHRHSVDAMFDAARARNMRLATGKVAMDIDCPAALRDTPETAYAESRELIERWHGVDRLAYAITPRYALTSSEAELDALGRLAREFPDVLVHTHLAENREEIDRVAKRYPTARSYLDVYRRHGLLRPKSVFAHCLHIDDADRRLLAAERGAIAFCPTSNLFLGSGLFDLAAADRAGVRTGVGTDVGAGTTLNMLATLGEAYKVLKLSGQTLGPGRALYLATLGAARALDLDDRIGNFLPGKEADFVVLDPASSPLLARRTAAGGDALDALFAMMITGDAGVVESTWVLGERRYRRPV